MVIRAILPCMAIILLAAAGAHAGQGADALVRDAIAAYDAMDFDKALPLLQEAEKLPGLSKMVRITILKYRAFCLILESKEILARDTVGKIYDLKPDFELAPTVSPKFRRFFAEVRKDWKPKVVRVIEAVPPAPAPRAAPRTAPPPSVEKPAPSDGSPNVFVRFWPSWACFAAGIGLLVPGTIIGLDATSGRDTLKNAPKDETGRMTTMTLAEAKKLQSDADQKGLTADILIGAGAAAVVTGAVMFFVYDGASEVSATKSTSVSFGVSGPTRLLQAAWAF